MFLDTFQVLKAIGFSYKYCYDTFRTEHPDLNDKLMHATLPLELNFIRHCRSVLKENNFDLTEFNATQISRRKSELIDQKKHALTPPCSPVPSTPSTLIESQPQDPPYNHESAALKLEIVNLLNQNKKLKEELDLTTFKFTSLKKAYEVINASEISYHRQFKEANGELRVANAKNAKLKTEIADIASYWATFMDTMDKLSKSTAIVSSVLKRKRS